MRMRLAVVGALLLALCLLEGCAKYWYQEGKSFKQTSDDLAACQREAAKYSDVDRTHGIDSYDGKFVRQCMEERGYDLVAENELPLRVKRESPPVLGMPGVAGTID
ncbi:MAG: hypothetical protein ABFE01_04630 [Phycisphaerales bacterium]